MGDMLVRNAWLIVAGLIAIGAVAAFVKITTLTAVAGVLAGFVLIWKSEHGGATA